MTDHTESSAVRARKDYSARLRRTDHFYEPLNRRMISALGIPPGSRVLDVGCGAGGFTALLAAAATSSSTACYWSPSPG